MPHLEGLEKKGELATASSLCNACDEVCPVKIPLPMLIRRMRDESYDMDETGVIKGHGFKKNLLETAVWKIWKLYQVHPFLNALMLKKLALFGNYLPKIGPLKAWTSARTAPVFGKKSLKDLVKKEGIRNE